MMIETANTGSGFTIRVKHGWLLIALLSLNILFQTYMLHELHSQQAIEAKQHDAIASSLNTLVGLQVQFLTDRLDNGNRPHQ